MNEFDTRYNAVMDIAEFNQALLSNCRSKLEKDILTDIMELRPGWVQNLEIAQKTEQYILYKKIWGVDDPTEKDYIDMISKLVKDQLDTIVILEIMRKYKDVTR